MARQSKLTPEIHDRVVAMMRAGNFRETAAAAVGIQSKTLRDWLRRGARGEAPFDELLADMSAAEAQAEARGVAVIGECAQLDWRAAAWRLERKNPERWGYQVKVAVHAHVKTFLAWLERELPPTTFAEVVTSADSFSLAGADVGPSDDEPTSDE